MRYGAETHLAPEEVVTRARRFFGPGGQVGLTETAPHADGVSFAGPDGGVVVTPRAANGMTTMTILSREYDYWAERFIRDLS